MMTAGPGGGGGGIGTTAIWKPPKMAPPVLIARSAGPFDTPRNMDNGHCTSTLH